MHAELELLVVMRLLSSIVAIIIISCLLIASECCAQTGLLVIPTAEIVGAGFLDLEYQINAPMLGGTGKSVNQINTLYGFSDKVEAGIDVDLSGGVHNRAIMNFKYLFAGESGERAAALGIYDVGPGFSQIPYSVGTYVLPKFRMSAGLQYHNNEVEPFIGIDRLLKGRADVCADWTAGDENFSSVGLLYTISDTWGGQLGVFLPNSSENERYLTFTISWTGRLF